MKKITEVGIKILALYFAAYFIIIEFSYIVLVFGDTTVMEIGRSVVYPMLAGSLFKLLFAICLWAFAARLAEIIVGKDAPEIKFLEEMDYEKLQVIIFSAIGVIFLGVAVPALIRSFGLLISMSKLGEPDWHGIFSIISRLVQIVIGWYLLFRTEKIVEKLPFFKRT